MTSDNSKLASPARLSSLDRTGLLDTLPEPQFDRVTRLISRWFEVPVSLLSLVDANRQFFKSSRGLPFPLSEQRQTPLSHSFCQHVVLTDKPFIVEDARTEPIVAGNPAVSELGVIAYAGVPIRAPDGHTLGSLCVVDTKPRSWSEEDVGVLKDMAAIVENELELREKARLLNEHAKYSDVLAREYHHRVKNALAVSASLVALSGRESASVPEAVEKTRGRLLALASAHDSLMSDSDEVDLNELVVRLLMPYCPPGAAADVEGPNVILRMIEVTPICLILHELATNSAKYGAFSEQGQVRVRWSLEGRHAVSLVWDEQSEFIDGKQRDGFGSKLLDIAAKQLQGRITTRWSPGQIEMTLAFPLGTGGG